MHSRQDVAVKVQADTDFGMPEAFGGDLRMNASSQQVSRMRMPEVTKTKLWERCFGNLADPILGQAMRLQCLPSACATIRANPSSR